MSEIPSELKYTASHEWVQLEDDGTAVVGISDYAQESLGDLVFVELPEIGDSLNAGDTVAVVESVKAASDIYAPVSGEVVAVNEQLVETPELINDQCYTEGWLIRLKMADDADLDDLMDADGYEQILAEEED